MKNFIVKSGLPFTIVRNEAFREFCGVVQPMRKIPCYQTVMKAIDQDFIKMVESLKKTLSKVDYVSITTDGWTAVNKSFLGYTVSWLNGDLQRKGAVLACRRFVGSHTYDMLANHINQVLMDYDIQNKTVGVTTDGATNYGKAFKMFASEDLDENDNEVAEDSDEDDDAITSIDLASLLEKTHDEDPDGIELPPHYICAAHALNLLGKKDIQKADSNKTFKLQSRSFFTKMRAIWNIQARSSKQADIIREVCKKLFKIPGETRWNSTYDSVVVALKIIEESGDNLAQLMTKLQFTYKFKQSDILFAKEYVEVMTPIATALDKLQGDDVTLGYVLPTIIKIKNSLLDFQDKKNLQICLPLVNSLLDGVHKRFEHLFLRKDYIIASVSTPMFKTFWITSQDKKAEAIEMLRSAEKSFRPKPDKTEAPCAKSNLETGDFLHFDDEDADEEEDPIEAYLKSKDRTLDLLKQFPSLLKVYQKFNTVLPSSASVERLFSHGSLIFGKKRHRLLDKNFEAQLMLKCNKWLSEDVC